MNTAAHRLIVSLVLLAGLVGHSPANESKRSAHQIYNHTLRATAWVIRPGVCTGTGWVVDRTRRLLITNQHVVEDAKEVKVIFPAYHKNGHLIAERSWYRKQGQAIRGIVLTVDTRRDLAIILLAKLPRTAVALPLAPRSAEPGERVHCVGNPGASGALWVYSSGQVRAVYQRKFITGQGSTKHVRDAQVLETQSPTNPGDSGGPVVNDRGQLVAVSECHRRNARLVTDCIDVKEVRAVLRRFSRLH